VPASPPELRVRVGVDIVGVGRIERLMAENADIERRLFTERELAYCYGKRRCFEHLAARFAAKEAVLKAIGSGLGSRMRWTDVEVMRGAAGRPHIRLEGAVESAADARGIAEIDVSLAHTEGYAVAQAVAVSCAST
jgi:holo-[acyl-carrier protein] synthase